MNNVTRYNCAVAIKVESNLFIICSGYSVFLVPRQFFWGFVFLNVYFGIKILYISRENTNLEIMIGCVWFFLFRSNNVT